VRLLRLRVWLEGLIDWARLLLSVVLVAGAVLLLGIAQRVDERPLLHWAKGFLEGMFKGLDEPQLMKPLGRLDGVCLVQGEVKLKPGGRYAALPLAGDDND
jgi:hypothetical protein